MNTGTRLNLTRSIRSAKTGMLLPREGTLVSSVENLGRTLLLVAFENGQREYLFEHEVEFSTTADRRWNMEACAEAHV